MNSLSTQPKRTGMRLAKPALVLAIFTCAAFFSSCRSETISPGDPLSFTATTIDGRSFNTQDHRGRVLLINFFANWCPPCHEEMPHLADMYRQYNPQGLDMIAIGGDPDEGVDVIQQFANRHNVPFPVIPPDRHVLAAIGGVRAFPTTLILDQQGVVRHRIVGAHLQQMEDAVKDLLQQ